VSATTLFNERLIALNISVTNSEEVIALLGELLHKEGYVKESFVENAIKREREFSTGLPLGPVNVALPHTDAIHVNRQAIAVGVLQNPVDFQIMGSPDQTVPVHVVFLMAIKEENQVKFLQTFAELLQDPKTPERIRCAKNVNEIIDLLQPQFQN
jgi:PTS system galactitol-specific IIA component